MTFLNLQTLVSSWLDDRNNGYFTLPEVKVWINNAQRETQKRLLQAGENFYVKAVETPTRAATSSDPGTDYVLPDDFLVLHRLEQVVSGTTPNEETSTVEPITVNQVDLFPNTPGLPAAYYLKRNRIFLWPPPDAVRTLRLNYSYLVADMVNDSDLPDVPVEYQEYIAVLATLDGFYKDNRDPSSFLEKKKYYEDLLKQQAEQRHQDQARMVVMTRNDGFENLF